MQRYPGGELPALHPVADMGIVEQKVVDAADAVRTLRARLDAHTAEQVRAKAWPPAAAARSVLLLSAAGHRAACASQGEGAAVPLEAMQRKADLLAEADALQRRMKQSQLTRWAAGRSRSSVLVVRTRLLVQAFHTVRAVGACAAVSRKRPRAGPWCCANWGTWTTRAW